MSFPRYPKYKPSGVEWLGDVPEGWEVKRSDSFLTYSRDQLDPKDFQGLEVFHYSIPVVQETGTGQIEDGAEIASGKQIVKKKVVLVSKLNPRKGTICIAEPQQALTLCSTEFVALEPNGCDIRYLCYLVRTEGFRQGLESKVTSVTNSHQRANPVDIYRFWNAWPVLPEQTAIAEFLDRETGKIDELVAEQRRLMELLKQKRQAVISHAVTKGLNPHAPMKPSGIEWLGDVPAGWEVARTSFFFKVAMGQTILAEDLIENGEWPVFSATDGDHYFGRINDPKVQLNVGDIVVPARGNSIGSVKLVKEPATTTQTTIYCKSLAPAKLHSNFVYQYFRGCKESLFYFTQTAIPQITTREVSSNPILIPPLSEQFAIVAFLETELLKFDTLAAEAQRAIDLLQERRTALISAAVTGQIDVRPQTHNGLCPKSPPKPRLKNTSKMSC